MKVNLNVMDRVIFTDLLPVQGNMLLLKVMQSIRNKVDLTIEDNGFIEIVLVNDGRGNMGFDWNKEKAKELGDITVDLSDAEMEAINKQYKELDEKSQLKMRDLSLWEKLLSGGK